MGGGWPSVVLNLLWVMVFSENEMKTAELSYIMHMNVHTRMHTHGRFTLFQALRDLMPMH